MCVCVCVLSFATEIFRSGSFGKGLKHACVHVLNLYSPNILLIEMHTFHLRPFSLRFVGRTSKPLANALHISTITGVMWPTTSVEYGRPPPKSLYKIS